MVLRVGGWFRGNELNSNALTDLGWSPDLARSVEGQPGEPARVVAVHRTRIEVLGVKGATSVAPFQQRVTVGDWVLIEAGSIAALVPRTRLIQRRAAGEERVTQLIAANVDTFGIVSSCNADFSETRIERYLALAAQADCFPLVILTKADRCEDPRVFRRRAEEVSPQLKAITIDARDPDEVARLHPWCRDGQVLVLAGMSGVGKTTLLNTLTGEAQLTASIREDDARGRHTTTVRSMRRTLVGGWLIDTPGMRELGMAGVAGGLDEVFADIAELANACRFRDCAHQVEPGCAVNAAVANGQLDDDRLMRWRKLTREDHISRESNVEARLRQKGLQEIYDQGAKRGRRKRGEDGRG